MACNLSGSRTVHTLSLGLPVIDRSLTAHAGDKLFVGAHKAIFETVSEFVKSGEAPPWAIFGLRGKATVLPSGFGRDWAARYAGRVSNGSGVIVWCFARRAQ